MRCQWGVGKISKASVQQTCIYTNTKQIHLNALLFPVKMDEIYDSFRSKNNWQNLLSHEGWWTNVWWHSAKFVVIDISSQYWIVLIIDGTFQTGSIAQNTSHTTRWNQAKYQAWPLKQCSHVNLVHKIQNYLEHK